jgi:HPt (histidine-containing phosphotransfer) domain-containing protein
VSSADLPAPLDERILADLHDDFASTGDLPELAELFRRYLESSADQLRLVTEAVESGSADAIKLAAHKLKGSSRTLGAGREGAVAAKLEEAAGDGDLPAARRTLSELETAFALTRTGLTEMIEAIEGA